MDTKALLEQLLNAAKSLTDQGRDLAEQQLGVPASGAERDAMLSGMGKGALAAGALALLLGTGSGRRITGSALKLGGLAAIGGLAYTAYQKWQSDRGEGSDDFGSPFGQLSGTAAQARSEALLHAMIAAAKADGHLDAQERTAIENQIEELGLATDAAQWLGAELTAPLDVHRFAQYADSPDTAAEIYVVSRLVIDVDNEPERHYLKALAAALRLDPGLVAQLEEQVRNT